VGIKKYLLAPKKLFHNNRHFKISTFNYRVCICSKILCTVNNIKSIFTICRNYSAFSHSPISVFTRKTRTVFYLWWNAILKNRGDYFLSFHSDFFQTWCVVDFFYLVAHVLSSFLVQIVSVLILVL